MTTTFLRSVFVALAATFFLSSSAQAHKIRVFAYESGGTIITEVKFGNGRPAQNSTVAVEKKDGSPLLSGTTDENGEFRFTVPQEALNQGLDLNIIADVGEGHRGSWLLEAGDYLAQTPSQKTEPAPEPASEPPSNPADTLKSDTPDSHELEERIEEIIRKELLPIKRMLAQEREKKPTLRDILGGLGYIFGLAGIAAYFKFKKNGVKS
ncbi:hypothetical protein [Desulfopila inferna]|uniref:hypothetical protein n=1 Tax=Desulfopila inferna TaxID=468528 RepID=UPI0019637AD9|nr:hypothetical protein [Desulfopila inferna]MBM9603917.1 hypothetical protein [Desulfopila inferna]